LRTSRTLRTSGTLRTVDAIRAGGARRTCRASSAGRAGRTSRAVSAVSAVRAGDTRRALRAGRARRPCGTSGTLRPLRCSLDRLRVVERLVRPVHRQVRALLRGLRQAQCLRGALEALFGQGGKTGRARRGRREKQHGANREEDKQAGLLQTHHASPIDPLPRLI
jgi:hypothetical protein